MKVPLSRGSPLPDPAPRGSKLANRWWFLAVAVWFAAVAGCFAVLWAYKARPGAGGEVATTWPSGVDLRLNAALPTLVLIAHPHCACTKASVAELARLMTHIEGRVRAYALFIRPDGVDPDWEAATLFADTARIPGVSAVWDRLGAAAQRFGAMTSGHVLLYAKDGKLLFSGGITASRGHEGETLAAESIIAAVSGGAPKITFAHIFGCALFSTQDLPPKESP